MDGELVLLFFSQLGDATQVNDVHFTFDVQFMNVIYLLWCNNQESILCPLVLVDLLDLVTEEHIL